MTRAAFSFRSRLDTIVVPKGDIHQSTLVRRHGTKLHAAVLTRRSIGGRTGDRLELLTLTTLVSFDVDNHRIAKPDGAHRDSRNQELQGVKRLAVTTNEHSKIITGNVQDELSIVTFVFVTSGNASIGVWIKLVIPAITVIVVQKKIKNLFRRENVMILSMNVCISSGYFNSLYTKRAFRSTIRSPSFKPDRR